MCSLFLNRFSSFSRRKPGNKFRAVLSVARRALAPPAAYNQLLAESRGREVEVGERGGGPMAIWAMPKWTAIFLWWGFPKGQLNFWFCLCVFTKACKRVETEAPKNQWSLHTTAKRVQPLYNEGPAAEVCEDPSWPNSSVNFNLNLWTERSSSFWLEQ